jgi:hypothetical protein
VSAQAQHNNTHLLHGLRLNYTTVHAKGLLLLLLLLPLLFAVVEKACRAMLCSAFQRCYADYFGALALTSSL